MEMEERGSGEAAGGGHAAEAVPLRRRATRESEMGLVWRVEQGQGGGQ